MAGHSHWAQIRHKKAIEDKKRSQIFSKLTNLIAVAAREDPNPETNPKLRAAIEKAKEFNLPKENIERAIKRGAGILEGEKLEEIICEAYGPEGVPILIKAITSNKNRTLGELRGILNKYQAKLAQAGSVLYLFDEKAVFEIKKEDLKEGILEKLIEKGALDLKEKEDSIVIYFPQKSFGEIKEFLEKENIKTLDASIDFVPKSYQEVSEESRKTLEALFESLDDHPDVEEIYSTLKI
ncbi:YebC/PmpR family DNA-binding transcriptional regulator [bacterium]|nr:YebC/PmpR family DNA-binding transcriptional regulator [bacterium]